MIYLKDQTYYSDLYDRITVDRCRIYEKVDDSNTIPSENGEKLTKEQVVAMKKMVSNLITYFYCGQRYGEKKTMVCEWMERDRSRDILVESARTPVVRCNSCTFLMKESSRSLDFTVDDKERVMFFMVCPNECLPNRILFDTGEEYKSKPILCEKCGMETTRESSKTKNAIITTDTCVSCKHAKIDTLDMTPEKKKADPDFEEDKKRFCLTDEEGDKRLFEIENLKRGAEVIEKIQEREKQKDLYDIVAKIEKLTIKNLETKLKEVFGKIGYADLSFNSPELGKDVFVPFIAYDSAQESDSCTSVQKLKKAVKEALLNTNWRLASDGINYRLGALTGRLHAYEREEDLLKLAREILEKRLENKVKNT